MQANFLLSLAAQHSIESLDFCIKNHTSFDPYFGFLKLTIFNRFISLFFMSNYRHKAGNYSYFLCRGFK